LIYYKDWGKRDKPVRVLAMGWPLNGGRLRKTNALPGRRHGLPLCIAMTGAATGPFEANPGTAMIWTPMPIDLATLVEQLDLDDAISTWDTLPAAVRWVRYIGRYGKQSRGQGRA